MTNKLLFLNASSGTILYFLTVVITFLLTPVVVNNLGKFDYGLWEMLVSIVGYMGILDLGIGPALLRNVAISHGQGDYKQLQKVFSTSLVFFCSLSLFSSFLYFCLYLYPDLIFESVQDDISRLQIVIGMFAVNTFIVFPMNVYIGTLFGLQQHIYVNCTRAMLLVFNGIFTYVLLTTEYADGLMIMASLQFFSNVTQFIVYTYLIKKNHLMILVSLKFFSFNVLRDLFMYGLKSSILMISSRLQFATMPFVIAKAASVDSIIYYSIPCRLIDYARGFSLAVGFPLTPHFTSLIGKDNREALIHTWFQSALFLQIITGSMIFILYYCGDLFLQLWIGKEILLSGNSIVMALLLGFLFQAFTPNSMQMLLASSRHGKVAFVYLIFALLSIPLAYYLVYYFGIVGAAYSNSIITAIVSVVTLWSACSFLETSFFSYIKKTIFPLLIPLFVLAFSLWLFKYFISPSSYISLIFNILFGLFIYSLTIWNFVFSRDIRDSIKSFVVNSFLKFT
jgi:O-antigen/teichoic acid export membrane protein